MAHQKSEQQKTEQQKIERQETDSKKSFWEQLNYKAFIPGAACLVAIIVAGVAAPDSFGAALTAIHGFLMDHFKWVYILVVVVIVALFLFILFSKYGNIRLGGKNAKPSISKFSWFCLTMTSTIAVGICFYGVAGPVNMFMNPPEFLGVEAGTQEAIIPVLEYCYLHYSLPPYFIILTLALAISLVYYNGRRSLRASDTLFPLLGKRSEGIVGTLANTLQVICLLVCGTNMGLAVIQLGSGVSTVSGAGNATDYYIPIIIFYTVLTCILATSGVHKLMGKVSNINAVGYFFILLFIAIVGPAGLNRLLGLLFTSVGQFVQDFIPMTTFADPIYETGWQDHMTIYYYAWNIAPAMIHALFYVSLAYGRTLREFVVYNCLLPAGVNCIWYTVFGGTAMLSILNGSDLYQVIQQFGDGISTFAFLDMFPAGDFLKWFFIVLAILTFLTFSDGVAFSFPMLLMKKTELDVSKTHTPKILNIVVAVFMGVLTTILLYVGGYDALCECMVVVAFPVAILLLFVCFSVFKFIFHRETYDMTYREEQALDQEKTTGGEAVAKDTLTQSP